MALLYPQSGDIHLVLFNPDMVAIYMAPLDKVPTVEELLNRLENGVWVSLLKADPSTYTIMVDGEPHSTVDMKLQPPVVKEQLHLCCLLANLKWRSPMFDVSGELPPMVSVERLMNPDAPMA